MAASLTLSCRGMSLLEKGTLVALMREAEKQQKWDPKSCPNGLLNVAGAENFLMTDFMEEYCSEIMDSMDFSKCLDYGPSAGSKALHTSMASFLNRYLNPNNTIQEEDIMITNGTSSLIEHLAWNIFDAGDGVILPTPTYAMFPYSLKARAGVVLLRAPMIGIEDQFKEECSTDVIAEFERVYQGARRDRVQVRGLLLCNPNNPTGRCYSMKTLNSIVKWCEERQIHLIVDEIYAMSHFREGSGLDAFSSVLSTSNAAGQKQHVHVIYGVSKDFGMGGLRLGFLVTKNKELRALVAKLGLYSWVTASSDAFFSRFISDPSRTDDYIKTFKNRLSKNYVYFSKLLTDYGIKFAPANAALFVWIDLSRYLRYFTGDDVPGVSSAGGDDSREIKLCRWLIGKGLFISPGEVSESPIPGHFRFTITMQHMEVEAAIKRLAMCLESLQYHEEHPAMC